MKTLLLSLIAFCPIVSFGQHQAFNVSYIYDYNDGTAWPITRGVQFGIGAEEIGIRRAPLVLACRFSTDLTFAKEGTRLDSIEFDLSEEHSSNMGFADVKYKKRSFALEFDLGFDRFTQAKLVPYVTFGPQIENYMSWLSYGLYNPDLSQSYDTDPFRFTHTVNLGYTAGAGLKIRPFRYLSIDLRATYYRGWSMNLDDFTTIPNTQSFHINSAGAPTVDFVERRDAEGLKLRVGIIFHVLATEGGGGGGGDYSDSGDSGSDMSTPIDTGSSSGGGGTTLTPVGGRGD